MGRADTGSPVVCMLAAMPQLSSTPQERANPPVRDRGDACPGALRLHRADDGALARVRIPGGLLTARQAETLADAAERLGDGRLDITSRGNLQLRGLDEGQAPQLAAALEASGLLPSPRHERVRNIVASPLSGLDGSGYGRDRSDDGPALGAESDKGSDTDIPAGYADVRPWAAQLDALLCESESATRLSGRFLFALDDGRGDVAALDADVTLLARPGGYALLRMGAEAPAVCVPAESAPHAALLAAETFLTVADGASCAAGATSSTGDGGARAWRVRELPEEEALFARRLTGVLAESGIAARYVPDAPSPAGAPPAPGIVEGPGDRCALSVGVPLGRLTVRQWRQLAAVAGQPGEGHGSGRYGTGELRVTPWRGVVLGGLPQSAAQETLRELEAAGLITHDASPWLGVGACTGLPGCAKSHRDVRADAAAALGAGGGGLPVYWSGCERRCGHPRGEWVDVVAGEDGYTVAVRGRRPSAPEAVADRGLAGAVASARARRHAYDEARTAGAETTGAHPRDAQPTDVHATDARTTDAQRQ